MQLLFCILSKNTNYITPETPETGKKKKRHTVNEKMCTPSILHSDCDKHTQLYKSLKKKIC